MLSKSAVPESHKGVGGVREGTSLCPESRVEIELVTRGDSFRGNKFSSLFGALIILGLVWGCKILDEGDGEGLGGAACSTVVYVLEGRVLIISVSDRIRQRRYPSSRKIYDSEYNPVSFMGDYCAVTFDDTSLHTQVIL